MAVATGGRDVPSPVATAIRLPGSDPLTASTFILLGMAGVELGAHQRFVFRWAFGTTLVVTAVALLTGAVPLP